LSAEQKDSFDRNEKRALEIEKKYGKENLPIHGIDVHLMAGRIMALRWVLGAEWDALLEPEC
jgi:hypothetical protein